MRHSAIVAAEILIQQGFERCSPSVHPLIIYFLYLFPKSVDIWLFGVCSPSVHPLITPISGLSAERLVVQGFEGVLAGVHPPLWNNLIDRTALAART